MSKHKKSIITLLIGGAGDKFILFAQGILIVPVYLSTIGVEVYGYWLATGGVLAWLGAFDMRMAVVINQKISALVGRGEEHSVARTFSSGLAAFGLILTPVVPIALVSFTPLANFLELPDELRSDFYLAYVFAALGLMLSFVTSALTTLPKGLLMPTFPVVIHFLCGLVQIVAVVYLLYSGFGVLAIGFAVFLRFLLSTIINLYYSMSLCFKSEYGRGNWFPSFSMIREYTSVMPTMFFSRLTTGLVSKIEPTIILRFLGPELAAAYSITKSAATVLTGLVNSVTASVFPSFATVCGGPDRERIENAFFRCMEFLSCASLLYFGGYVLLNAQFVALWVGEEFFLGNTLTALIALSLVSITLTNFLNSSLTAKGDVVFASWLRAAEEISRLILLIAGIAIGGLFGLPVATILSATIILIPYSIRFKQQFEFPVFSLQRIRNYVTMAVITPLILCFAALSHFIQPQSWSYFVVFLLTSVFFLVTLCLMFSALFRSLLVTGGMSFLCRLRAVLT